MALHARCLKAAGAAQVFSKDETGMLRSWGPRANIPAVNQKAREAASQLLAQLAVLRIDSKQVKFAERCSLLSLHQESPMIMRTAGLPGISARRRLSLPAC